MVGLTGISALDDSFGELPLRQPEVSLLMNTTSGAAPLGGNGGCSMTTPAALVDGVNLTTDPLHMWHVTGAPRQSTIVLTFELGTHPVLLRGLRIWNYNESGEESCKGAKHVQLYVDGVSKMTLILRKAPGEANIEYAQFVHLVGRERSGRCVGDSLASIKNDRKHSMSRSASLSKMNAGTRSTSSITDTDGILDPSVGTASRAGLLRADSDNECRIDKTDSFDRAFPKRDDEDDDYKLTGESDSVGENDLTSLSNDQSDHVITKTTSRNFAPQRLGMGQITKATSRSQFDDSFLTSPSAPPVMTNVSTWGEELSTRPDVYTDRVLCDVTQQYETSVSE